MSIFSFFSRRPNKSNRKARKSLAAKAHLNVEALEDRFLPSGSAISGFVFADANNNGIYDPGETPIANAPVQLQDAANNILGNTTTDANGFYQFNQDATVNQGPVTITKTLTFPSTQTDYTLPGSVAQFDPSLGQLQSVQVIHDGSITSDIKVENTSPVSPSSISGTVGGSLELTGPGVASTLTMSQNAGSFNASAFDGALDYGGASGTDFGAKTATGTKTVTLTGADMTPYIGTGQVAFTENAHASSYASGGGNLNVTLESSGKSTVTVVYEYLPNKDEKPRDYTVIQTAQPPGFTDGKISSGGVVIDHPPNVDVIHITLDGTNDSPHNDFGKLQAPTTTVLDAPFGRLPALGKIQLFGVDTTPYIDPVLRGQMTFVSGAYETFLGRAPSYSEFMGAVGQLQAGAGAATIATNLQNTDEHRAKQASLYGSNLNSVPTASAQSQTQSALAVQSAVPLAQSPMTSTARLSTLVNDAYRAILRRSASQAEIQDWVARLQDNTVSFDQMEVNLLASPEFYELAAKSISAG